MTQSRLAMAEAIIDVFEKHGDIFEEDNNSVGSNDSQMRDNWLQKHRMLIPYYPDYTKD